MLDHEKKVLLETQDWDSYCGDGCCYDYGTNIFVNGKQVSNIEGLYDGIEPIISVLESLGYEVEHKEIEGKTYDFRVNFEEEV